MYARGMLEDCFRGTPRDCLIAFDSVTFSTPQGRKSAVMNHSLCRSKFTEDVLTL
jgi:hypothetical protein